MDYKGRSGSRIRGSAPERVPEFFPFKTFKTPAWLRPLR